MPRSATGPQGVQRPIGPVTFEVADCRGAVDLMLSAIRRREGSTFAFCNMHTFNLATRMPELVSAMGRATIFNDGFGIDLASKLLVGEPFPANLNGTDLTDALLRRLDRPTSIYFVGSAPGVAQRAAEALRARFPMVTIAGSHHGFFNAEEGEALVAQIRASGAELLLLGMGNPRQELWADEISGRTGAVVLCIGAYLDFASGAIRRAPRIFRALRLEWTYRLMREPARMWRRYLGGAAPFLFSVLADKRRRRLEAERAVAGPLPDRSSAGKRGGSEPAKSAFSADAGSTLTMRNYDDASDSVAISARSTF